MIPHTHTHVTSLDCVRKPTETTPSLTTSSKVLCHILGLNHNHGHRHTHIRKVQPKRHCHRHKKSFPGSFISCAVWNPHSIIYSKRHNQFRWQTEKLFLLVSLSALGSRTITTKPKRRTNFQSQFTWLGQSRWENAMQSNCIIASATIFQREREHRSREHERNVKCRKTTDGR